ncbi:MAG: Bug family tripartite tricarboxylate transporter substrate binding protein [Burkholderiales bacterium]
MKDTRVREYPALRHFRTLSLLLIIAAAPAALAQGADYPTKTVTLVLGYPPGGSTDLTARAVAAAMSKRLGQQVLVENVGGAGGTLGAQRVAQAAPDGYTLFVGTNSEMAISALINPAIRYDSQRDFTPLGLLALQPLLLVASTQAKVRNTDEFVALARRNPGRFSFGSAGFGHASHLAGEMVKDAARAFIVHIPYRGVGPLTTDLIGGQLEFGVFVLSTGLPHVRSGKVVALGTFSAKRAAAAPDIPALAEHPALKNIDISTWFGMWGPAKLPAAVTQRLTRSLAESLAADDVRKRLEDSGATMAPAGAMLADYQRQEIEKYARIIKVANIRE